MTTALLFKLKLPTESAWHALRDAHLVDARGRWLHGIANVVELGVFRHQTGRIVEVDGPGGTKMQVPELVDAPVPGFHVDFTGIDVPSEAHQFCVNPANPRHVYAGNLVLAMPEVLPEAEDVAMVTRGVGQQVPDDVLARLELAVLRGRLTPEMAADRRAWIEAGIAITEARAALSQARQDRERAIEDARRADAERDRLLALRQAEVDKRAAAVAAMTALTGAARQAEAAKRDAATAQMVTLADGISAQASALGVAIAARDSAAAEIEAERVRIAAARVQRDVLKAALK